MDKDIAAVEAVAEYLPVAVPAQSRWKWLLSGAKKQAAAHDALVAISQIMATPGTDRVVTLLQDLSREVDTAEMRRGIPRAPDEYHAIISIAVPYASIAGRVATRGREERASCTESPAPDGARRGLPNGRSARTRSRADSERELSGRRTPQRTSAVTLLQSRSCKPEHAGDPTAEGIYWPGGHCGGTHQLPVLRSRPPSRPRGATALDRPTVRSRVAPWNASSRRRRRYP